MRDAWTILRHMLDYPDDQEQWRKDGGIIKCRMVNESACWYGTDIFISAYPDPTRSDCISLEVSNGKRTTFYRLFESDDIRTLGTVKASDIKTKKWKWSC
jgi:hypothetical protein